MYEWKKLKPEVRQELLEHRKKMRLPWHSPPHFDNINNTYMLTAANYKHSVIAGSTLERLVSFQNIFLNVLCEHTIKTYAWCILPNHYHALIETENLKYTLYGLGQMHGRLSRFWNLEDRTLGRQCWFRCSDRIIRSERHLYTAVNYIHYNPVKHGYVDKIDTWLLSSASDFLSQIEREKAVELWKKYPLLDYGKGWDD